MYADTRYQIARDRIAGLHRHAQHDALARAARRSRRGRRPSWHQDQHHLPQRLLTAGRGALTALGAHT
jgi:hypothetical protein